MAKSTSPIVITDVTIEKKKDGLIVRLVNGNCLEIRGDGQIFVYVNNGADFAGKCSENQLLSVLEHYPEYEPKAVERIEK